MKKIILLMPYFGCFPEWFDLYLESCRWNPTIDWLFFTDCGVPENAPANVRFIQMSFQAYQQLVCDRLNINFQTHSTYTVCNLRPAYGWIHQEHLAGYDYFGFGDVDVIYGNLRVFYTDAVLDYNTISTHSDRVSGHLFLIKNNEYWVNAFRRIPDWQNLMSQPINVPMDEGYFTKQLLGRKRLPSFLRRLWGIVDPDKRHHLFQERFSTVLSDRPWMNGTYAYPTQWFWHRGKLTVETGEELMYLHFMNWKSSRYLRKRYGDQAAWEKLSQLVDPNLTDLSQGFCISPLGFTPIESTAPIAITL
ncbi:hypothetical protein Q2T42_16590 [Leptolyngbya boryana CZ1]|uniref:Uncharacterized protein n=1 Tax=Leptolyngbya boryana CZ1 TaxID=3060204 RepID=A0AA97AKR8_LEPBY|nr:DUF6625 family protein [Leptolyngbya boryana]WNZ43463.1 hypothetical protein Q2T42_16590 [Leptolyngbya boryana CZ1]